MEPKTIRDLLLAPVKPVAPVKKQTPTTLEAHHRNKMREFDEIRLSLPTLKEELATLESQSCGSEDEHRRIADLIQALKKKIAKIESNDAVLDYFLEAGAFLNEYADSIDNITVKGPVRKAAGRATLPANSILRFFMEEKVIDRQEPELPPQPKRASVIETHFGHNRDKILEEFLAVVDPSAIKKGLMPGSGVVPGWDECPRCGTEMTLLQNEATIGCQSCGHEVFFLIDSEKPSYKDPPREVSYFAYKKINHFNEWLSQFQEKESVDVPQTILDAIMAFLKTNRITDPCKITKEKICEILHRLKLSKFTEQAQKIRIQVHRRMNHLTLSNETVEKLQHMFKEIQPAYIKYCPKVRSNFMSYPYVLYKLCQLLEMDEFLPCFQLLKSRQKLCEVELVWRKICKDLHWEYYPSV